MILDTIENYNKYAQPGARIARGLEWLANENLNNMPDGKIEIDGTNIFASVQSRILKLWEECRWEAHRSYIDIQYVVSGTELMGYCPSEKLVPAGEYDDQKDTIFFRERVHVGTLLKVEAGMFVVFFPQDAHMPMLSLKALGNSTPEVPAITEQVKKIILKVAVN